MLYTWNRFPFQNFNEINLDWLLKEMSELKDNLHEIENKIGDLEDLETEDKSNIVSAINEIYEWLREVNNGLLDLAEKVGPLNDLLTTDKSSIVNAINEVATNLQNAITALQRQININANNISTLSTTLENLIDTVDRVEDDLGSLTDRVQALEGNAVTWEQMGVLGTKNLLSYPYADTTLTRNGITFTDNGDGSITLSGTSTGNSRFHLKTINTFELKPGTYIFTSGCDSVVSPTTYFAQITGLDGDSYQDYTNEGITFTINSDTTIGANIIVYGSGVTANNVTFRPMVRLSSITNKTWAPYSMTNYELTKALNRIGTELIWENPSPSTSFAGQNVSLQTSNLADYQFYVILWGDGLSVNYGGNGTILTRGNGTTLRFEQFSGAGLTFGYREVGYNEGSTTTLFIFGDAYGATIQWQGIAQPHAISQDDDYCIPYQIYGVK